MPRSLFKKPGLVVLFIAASCLLLAAVQKPACAQETEHGVVRTFAVFGLQESDLPDFFSDSSLGVLIAPPERVIDHSFMRFTGENSDYLSNWDPFFDFTLWESRVATHITKGGTEILAPVKWLVDDDWRTDDDTLTLPPTGSITLTGPDSPFILDQKIFHYDYDSATAAVNVVLINHLLSAIEAAWSARSYNRQLDIKLSVHNRKYFDEQVQMYGINLTW